MAKPWHRRRALWIFRDQTGLSVTPGLWTSIQTALDNSEYFVLMASPEAARSQWVNREIEHWVATKRLDRILPVVTDGEWSWDPELKDFDPESTSVPPALRGVFAEEPLYLDLRWARNDQHLSLRHSRFRDAIAQLAAPMHGVSKDDLEGEDVRQHRRAGRLRLSAVASLLVLTVLAATTGMSAMRNAAQANASAVEARLQQQEASTQRGSAAKFAGEAQRNQERARENDRLARDSEAEAERQKQSALAQKALADKASGDVKTQLANADKAAARAKQQEKLARDQSRLARESARQMREQQKRAKEQERIALEQQKLAAEAGADAAAQKKIAERQKTLAAEAAELAEQQEKVALDQEQQAKRMGQEAARQQRIAISRRLVNEAKATIDDDAQLALRLGVAATRISSETETRREVASLVTSTRHAGAIGDVSDIAYGPGTLFATIEPEGLVAIWDVANRAKPARIATINDAGPATSALAWSPNGQTLAIVWQGGGSLWDVSNPADPAPAAKLPTDRQYWAVAFSPNNRTLVTGDVTEDKGYATLWDVTNPRRLSELSTLKGGRVFASTVFGFSPDSHTLVAGHLEADVWDISNRSLPVRRSSIEGRNTTHGMAFSSDQRLLARGDATGEITVHNLSDPAEPLLINTLKSSGGYNLSLAFSPDGSKLAAGHSDGRTTIWDVATWQPQDVGKPTGSGVTAVSWSKDGRTLATADIGEVATLWNASDFASPQRRHYVPAHYGSIPVIKYSADGRLMTSVSTQGVATEWEVDSKGEPKWRKGVYVHRGKAADLVDLTADRRLSVAGDGDGNITLTDLTDMSAEVLATTGVGRYLRVLMFSPDDKLLLIGKNDGFTLWDVSNRRSPKPLGTTKIDDEPPWHGASFSADGKLLALAGGKTVSLWDLSNRKRPKRAGTLTGHGNAVSVVKFSPTERIVATGSDDRTAVLWNVSKPGDPQRLTRLTGHANHIETLTFDQTGTTLVTTDSNSVATMWDVAIPTRPIRLSRIPSVRPTPQSGMTFTPDGNSLTASPSSSTDDLAFIGVWDLSELSKLRADPTAFGCSAAGGGLTRTEWALLIPELKYEQTCH